MIVKYKEPTTFKDIALGNCFAWQNHFYMKICQLTGDLDAVNLSTGRVIGLTEGCIVVPVNIEACVV